MAAAESAGIVLYRRNGASLEVLLVHPGGPYWRGKDAGAWTIPKGLIDAGEEALDAAVREMREETGVAVDGPFIPLGPVKQKAGKVVTAFACEGDCDPAAIVSNTFELEWPPRSGRMQTFPEVDRAGWFTLEGARERINAAQVALLEELQARLG
jgi:predicted NUDIX family NTP pyrophosphohydrolase